MEVCDSNWVEIGTRTLVVKGVIRKSGRMKGEGVGGYRLGDENVDNSAPSSNLLSSPSTYLPIPWCTEDKGRRNLIVAPHFTTRTTE